jgi:hypothetical protein
MYSQRLRNPLWFNCKALCWRWVSLFGIHAYKSFGYKFHLAVKLNMPVEQCISSHANRCFEKINMERNIQQRENYSISSAFTPSYLTNVTIKFTATCNWHTDTGIIRDYYHVQLPYWLVSSWSMEATGGDLIWVTIYVSSWNSRRKTRTILLTIFGVPPETLNKYLQSLNQNRYCLNIIVRLMKLVRHIELKFHSRQTLHCSSF